MSQEKVDRSGDSKHLSYYFLVLIAAIIALSVGVVFWIGWGHDLHYNVYADGEFWYREEFPNYFKAIVTSFLSVIFGLGVVAIIRIVQYVKRGS